MITSQQSMQRTMSNHHTCRPLNTSTKSRLTNGLHDSVLVPRRTNARADGVPHDQSLRNVSTEALFPALSDSISTTSEPQLPPATSVLSTEEPEKMPEVPTVPCTDHKSNVISKYEGQAQHMAPVSSRIALCKPPR